ncbi:hypothetical protein ACOZ38_25260 [Sphaerisporangium viridialbum]|uniref:hypothetical protein n=1 Tax=Sphaerisporangium viridialbum TaxID=46189 RepID=UPI003C79127E
MIAVVSSWLGVSTPAGWVRDFTATGYSNVFVFSKMATGSETSVALTMTSADARLDASVYERDDCPSLLFTASGNSANTSVSATANVPTSGGGLVVGVINIVASNIGSLSPNQGLAAEYASTSNNMTSWFGSGPVPAAGSRTYTVNGLPTPTVGGQLHVLGVVGYGSSQTPKSGTDSATLTEGAAGVEAADNTSDAGTLDEGAAVAVAPTSRADSAGLAEKSTVTLPVSDQAALTEQAALTLPVVDTAGLVESAVVQDIVGPWTTDSGQVSDFAAVAASVPVTDQAAFSEQASVGIPLGRADTAALTEKSNLGLPTADGAGLAETASVAVALARSDSAVLAERSAAGHPADVDDTAVLTEAAAVIVDRNVIWSAGLPYVEWAAEAPYSEWAAAPPSIEWAAEPPSTKWASRPSGVEWATSSPYL